MFTHILGHLKITVIMLPLKYSSWNSVTICTFEASVYLLHSHKIVFFVEESMILEYQASKTDRQ